MKVFLVQAAAGDYDEKSWWPVAVWSTRLLAEQHAKRLNWCAGQLADALSADPCPPDTGDDDADVKAFEEWKARREKLLAEWRELSGDAQVGEYHQPTYSWIELPMRTRATRTEA